MLVVLVWNCDQYCYVHNICFFRMLMVFPEIKLWSVVDILGECGKQSWICLWHCYVCNVFRRQVCWWFLTMQISLSSMVFDHWSKKGLFLCMIFHDICDMYITLVFSLSTYTQNWHVCNNVMYIITRIKEILGFFHDAGWPCSGFFNKPPGMCVFYECLIG
jgi:hypothetical protein